MSKARKSLLPFPPPFGFREWANAVLRPETVEALAFDPTSALAVLGAYRFALDNPKAAGTNLDRVPAEVLRRMTDGAARRRRLSNERFHALGQKS